MADPAFTPLPAVDFDHLRMQTFGDADLEREVLGLFLGQSAMLLAAVADPGADRVGAAHKLLGSARGIGATATAAAAAAAERALASDPASAGPAVAALAEAVVKANAVIRARLEDGGPSPT